MEHMDSSHSYHVYKDIQIRTNGEIYIGVVGPVRTGKSTFIKRFMDLLVIPEMDQEAERQRAIDEMPQASGGRTIMTTEPKFIPKDAASISLADDIDVKVRMIDCVGYMVEGATGHIEDDRERMVKTPWFDHTIPFTQAAEIGTRKVIEDHSTIGIVVTTDGSFGDLDREDYRVPEQRTVNELKSLGKPFVMLMNSTHPYSEETQKLVTDLENEYGIRILAMNCEQLRKDDILKIMETVLSVFPIVQIDFYLPKWFEMLPLNHWLKQEIIQSVVCVFERISQLKDVKAENFECESEYVKSIHVLHKRMEDGIIQVKMELDDNYYYQILSDLVGIPIEGEYQLIAILKELAARKLEYEKVGNACEEVRVKGYGVVSPTHEEVRMEAPEVIRHGNKFGVKIKAISPSIHMIRADIETEIAPIVGTQEQAEDLIAYIKENGDANSEGIWDTNIFGKSIRQLVEDGIQNKVNKLTDESQLKLQEAIQKIVNDSNGGLVCFII